MLAYYTTTKMPCQPLFEKFFRNFNLAPLNLSFSSFFGCFCAQSEVLKSFFSIFSIVENDEVCISPIRLFSAQNAPLSNRLPIILYIYKIIVVKTPKKALIITKLPTNGLTSFFRCAIIHKNQ